MRATPETITDLGAKPGGTPSGEATLLNLFNRPVAVDLSGRIEGYRKSDKKKLKPDDDKKKISLDFTSDLHAARIHVEISEDDYARFTDIPISVYDSSGKAIAQGSLEGTETTMTVDNPEPEAESCSASLEIRPAFTYPDSDESAEFKVEIDYLYKDPIDVEVKRGEASQTTLYPAIPTGLSWSLKKMPPETPEGTSPVGYLRASEKTTKQPIAQIEILGKK